MEKKRRIRFNGEKIAHKFAKEVNGKVNDLRKISGAKSNFTVTFVSNEKTRSHAKESNKDQCPEEDRDFGYPNWYWKELN